VDGHRQASEIAGGDGGERHREIVYATVPSGVLSTAMAASVTGMPHD
jgi:hypothetical protein